jgi:hypothetical protein
MISGAAKIAQIAIYDKFHFFINLDIEKAGPLVNWKIEFFLSQNGLTFWQPS